MLIKDGGLAGTAETRRTPSVLGYFGASALHVIGKALTKHKRDAVTGRARLGESERVSTVSDGDVHYMWRALLLAARRTV